MNKEEKQVIQILSTIAFILFGIVLNFLAIPVEDGGVGISIPHGFWIFLILGFIISELLFWFFLGDDKISKLHNNNIVFIEKTAYNKLPCILIGLVLSLALVGWIRLTIFIYQKFNFKSFMNFFFELSKVIGIILLIGLVIYGFLWLNSWKYRLAKRKNNKRK